VAKTTTATIKDDVDPLFYDKIKKILGELDTLYDQGYQEYGLPRIQGFTEDQLKYMQGVRDLQGYGQTDLKDAVGMYKDVAGSDPSKIGIRGIDQQAFDSQAAKQYMDPYIDNVLDRQRRRMYRTDDIARQGRDARAVQAGAFGGDRQAIAEAESQRALQDRIADQEARALSQAYTTGANIFRTDADRALKGDVASQTARLTADRSNQFADLKQLENQMKAAQGIAGLTTTGQQLTGQQLGMLSGVGGAQQQMGQAGLDLAYQDFDAQRRYPYEQLQFYMGGLQGFPSYMVPGTQTQTTTSPSMSNMGRLAGLGINALGMYGMGTQGFSEPFALANLFPYG
jgi:hypothetical protein